ncbi:lysozyme inhibitor LprI family protein [Vogesella amnigena]|uniref:Lysozyme inhibitor LprI family protein n=1 Tax=Vogesella amnigena TaxID=1507449 RepID=A0ABV7TSQ3_9NEIS
MRHLIRILSLGLGLTLATGALANSSCDKPRNDFDDLYCLNKVYSQADKDLNDNYSQLAKLLDGDGRRALKGGQLQWMRQRNDNCSYRDQRGFFVNLDCATQTTLERVRFLQDRVRECKSAGCMNSKL